MKKQKGITLIALVITIVIVVILGGISVSFILGENGIISRAKSTKNLIKEIEANEQVALSEVSNQMEELIKKEDKDIGYPGGNYDDPYIPAGFIYIDGTWNDGYVIQEKSTENEFVWVPCVTDQNKVKEGDTVVTFGKTLPTTTASTNPLYKYNHYNLSLLPTFTTVPEEDSSVAEIRTSVETYGGFYIARYEAGLPGTTTSTKSNDTNKQIVDGTQKPISKSNVGVWNYIAREDAITLSKAMIDNNLTGAKTTLISGECWDTTMQWMVNASDNKSTNAGYDINSTGKGWYNNVSSSTLHTTGYYAINKIYDMAGNAYEWTTENCIGDNCTCRIQRGGYYDNSSSYSPAAARSYIGIPADDGVGFRPILYK